MDRMKGFTLIELLIVVAIIAILAAIAVPNFLEAQVRAKVSRAANDMRAMANAIESYHIDYGIYPPDANAYNPAAWVGIPPYNEVANPPRPPLNVITTPVAYMTSISKDVFQRKYDSFWFNRGEFDDYVYVSEKNWMTVQRNYSGAPREGGHKWGLASIGPDRLPGGGTNMVFGLEYALTRPQIPPEDTWGGGWVTIYDPTNGTISPGDIARVGP